MCVNRQAREGTCLDRSADFGLDVDGASSAFIHELLRCFVQRLRVGIKNLDAMMFVDQRKAFCLSCVVLYSEHNPETVSDRNFDEVVNKTVYAIYGDLYR